MIDSIGPDWVIVETKALSEDPVERGPRLAGYRTYVPRYRKLLAPHGSWRQGTTSMRPLFPRLVFAQDWRGWPARLIAGVRGLVQARPGVTRLADQDVTLIMAREYAGEFDDMPHQYGSGKYMRDDIRPGEEVEIKLFGRNVLAVLSELTPNGTAIVEALLFDERRVRTEVDAGSLRKVAVSVGIAR
jgi:hypothetical protein